MGKTNRDKDFQLIHVEYALNLSANTDQSNGLNSSSISYAENKPANPDLWNSQTHPISIFGDRNSQSINTKNIKVSLLCIADFIKNRDIKHNRKKDISYLEGFGKAIWTFITSILEGEWSKLKSSNNNKTFCQKILEKISNNILVHKNSKTSTKTLNLKPIEFLNVPNISSPLPLLVLLRLSKEKLNKSKFHSKNINKPQNQSDNNARYTYAQASSVNILKLKDNFPNLLNKKIENIHETINNTDKIKLHINMITKGPSCKQIIVPMGNKNISRFMASSSEYIANLNKALKLLYLLTSTLSKVI